MFKVRLNTGPFCGYFLLGQQKIKVNEYYAFSYNIFLVSSKIYVMLDIGYAIHRLLTLLLRGKRAT